MLRTLWQKALRFLSSLGLTVTLLALSLVLILLATLDQVDLGIYAVQEKWFRSFVLVDFADPLKIFRVFFDLPHTQKIAYLYPGGYTLGFLLLFNLIAAHATRFKLTWKKSGIFLTHIGLILLLLGEFFSGVFQEDFQMRIDEGQTKNYSESFHFNELAVIDATDSKTDRVTAIPTEIVANQKSISHSTLPFRIEVKAYYPHAAMQLAEQAKNPAPQLATTGFGRRFAVTPFPVPKSDDITLPAAYIELIGTEGSLGTILVSAMSPQPESFNYAGKTWQIGLRVQRKYKPFSLHLIKVTHDIYPGSDIPKNYASQVRLQTEDGREDQEFKIYMNNPLRFGGFTFYQYQMQDAPKEKFSVFQVVRNPSWLVPYIACLLMAVGLAVQFIISLVAFGKKRTARRPHEKAASHRRSRSRRDLPRLRSSLAEELHRFRYHWFRPAARPPQWTYQTDRHRRPHHAAHDSGAPARQQSRAQCALRRFAHRMVARRHLPPGSRRHLHHLQNRQPRTAQPHRQKLRQPQN
ncbi:MAG: cytochrome c biogenesis protein ResB [Nibricoccus sp.]